MAKSLPKTDYQDLERLYKDRTPSDSSRLDQRPPRPLWQRALIVGCVLIVLASAAAWGGFYIFNAVSHQSHGQLDISFDAPSSVAAGEPLTYHVTLLNRASDTMQNVHLRVNYPDGFLWQSSSLDPEGESHNTWTINSLAPNQPKTIDVNGILLGDTGSVLTFFATATYNLPNFQSALESSNSTAIKLDASHVQVTWSGPGETPTATNVEYKIHYTYDGESALPDGQLVVQMPDGFTVSKATPALGPDNQLHWPVKGLTKGASGDIIIDGQWNQNVTGDQALKAIMQTTTTNQQQTPMGEGDFTTTIGSGDLVLNVMANGSATPPAVALGATIHWTLNFQNTTTHTMSNLEVHVTYDGSYIDWPHVAVPDGGVVQGQTIIWQSANTPELAALQPKGSGTLSWDTPLVSTTTDQSGTWQVSATPTFEHHTLDNNPSDQTYTGATLSVPISTAATLDVEARYFDDNGAPLGTGPLPPKVDTATTYQLTWKITGTVHTLTAITIEGDLPPGVTATSGTASFGSEDVGNSSKPVWHIDSLEAGLEPTATFTVTLTPTADDAGRILVLSGKTVMTATDSTTSGAITVAGSTATTNLDTDTIARGKGVVVK